MYPHLGLKNWPFRITPDQSFYSFIADREQLSRDVDAFLRHLTRRAASTIHLMWAWYGAGKTHTLKHVEFLCKTHHSGLVPVYTEFPRGTRNFLDLYRLFISGIDMQRVSFAYEEVFTNPRSAKFHEELQFDYPDLVTALRKCIGGNEQEKAVAIRWLRAESSELRTFRGVGMGRSVSTEEDAIRMISWVVRLLGQAAEGGSQGATRLIWMIDEYQRIRDCRPQSRVGINACLHSIFNRCPNSLTIVISFSGKPESNKFPAWLSPELRDRIGIEKVFLLPPLSTPETEKFVLDALAHFRNSGSNSTRVYFPFTPDSLREVIKIIVERGQLKPRSIMQFFNAVLEEADPRIEAGEMKDIDVKFVRDALKDRVFSEEEESP